MEKVLWFEGAGCEGTQRNDVPNCRIRTAFMNDEGRWVYLEITEARINKEQAKSFAGAAGWKAGDSYCHIDSAHYITDDPSIDDCNESRLAADVHSAWHLWYWNGMTEGNIYETLKPYTMDGILRVVNEDCHASFDRIIVAPDILAGYRVFNDSGKVGTFSRYNYGDAFIYDEVLHKAMRAKRDELQRYHKEVFSQRYSDNTSYWNASDGSYTSNLMNVCINVGEQKRKAVYSQRQFMIDVTTGRIVDENDAVEVFVS